MKNDQITFGTDGWRAIIAEQFTFANVERVAFAVGKYIQSTYHEKNKDLPVLVGYDTRFLADKFALHAAKVLISMGIPAKVTDRDVPTPAIAYNAQVEPTAGAIQLTASHNPPEYCGIKYITHVGGPATNAVTAKIVSYLNDLPADFDVPNVEVPRFNAKPLYMQAITKHVDMERIVKSNLKVAYDALFSTSRDYLDDILNTAGLQLQVIHNWRDPLFGGGMPEPKAEYLQELKQIILKEKCDVGLATDGDADRFAIFDEKGNYLSPNQLLALLTRHLVKNRGLKGAIVRTVATTHLLDRMAELYNLDIIETPVGFKYISEVMCTKDVLIGGEESGGVSVKGHIPEKDGILGNMMIVEMMAYERKPLSLIWDDLLREAGMHFNYRRKDLHLNHTTQSGVMERLVNDPFSSIGKEKVQRLGRKDGFKFYLDESNWLLVRPSGTEPILRLYAEGTDSERIDKIMSDFVDQVNDVVREIETGGKITCAK